MDLKNQTQKITIKFRALKDDMSNCRFYYGSLIYDKEGNPRIYDVDTNTFHTCIKGTEGQFTGLHDKNGKEIYKGDILNVCNGSINGNGWFDKPYSVEFKCGKWDIPLFMWDKDGQVIMDSTHWCEVIGNVFENADLVKL